MDNTSGTVSVWDSGRLASRAAPRRFEFGREQWLATALLILSAGVLAAYVAVLQRDVDGGAMQRQAQRSRAVAEAQCEADRPVEQRGRCSAILSGDVATLEAPTPLTPDNTAYLAAYEQENLARSATLSLLATR